MKKILTAILCLFALVFCGCSVEPQYSVVKYANGSVDQHIYIPFSAQELLNSGIDVATFVEMQNDLKTEFNNFFYNIYTNYKTRLLTDSGLDNNDKIIIENGCPKEEDIKSTSDYGGIIYEFKFDSVLHYYYFNSSLYYEDLIEELNKDDSVTEKGFFTNRIIQTSETVFGVNTQFDSSKTFAQYITARCKTKLEQKTTLSQEKIDSIIPKTYVYRYGTSSKRVHSDADNIKFVDGIYYHEWNISVENSDRQISLWNTVANKNVWYAGILIAGVILAVVLLSINKIKTNKTKPKIVVEKPE